MTQPAGPGSAGGRGSRSRPARRAVVGLGSNQGQRLAYLQGAVDSLSDTPGVEVLAVSPVYETVPVGGPAGAPDYLNAVVVVATTLPATVLLERALAIESAFGRERNGEPGMPRTLDVDLVAVDDLRCEDGAPVLPHPRAAERAFVLAPWHDVDPGAELIGSGSVARLLEKAGTAGVRRRDDLRLRRR